MTHSAKTRSSAACSGPRWSGMHSSSSPSSVSIPAPRLWVRPAFQRSSDRFRVIRPSHARSALGRSGGMAFQARK